MEVLVIANLFGYNERETAKRDAKLVMELAKNKGEIDKILKKLIREAEVKNAKDLVYYAFMLGRYDGSRLGLQLYEAFSSLIQIAEFIDDVNVIENRLYETLKKFKRSKSSTEVI